MRESEGVYQFGSKRIAVKVEKDKSFYINHYNTHGFIIEDGLFWVGPLLNIRQPKLLRAQG
jgi:hypothetical protein